MISSKNLFYLIIWSSTMLLLSGSMCPITFHEYMDKNGNKVCWQIKNNESFFEKYERCSGNIASIDLSHLDDSILSDMPVVDDIYFWTDYVRAYENGPFINWLIGDDEMGQPLLKNVSWENNNDNGTCVVMSLRTRKYKMVDCREKYYRFCVINTYNNAYPISWNCPTEYLSFPSPIAACIFSPNSFSTVRNVPVRATWLQAHNICRKNSGNLLHRGYIYSNHPEFNSDKQFKLELPLGIKRIGNNFKWAELNESISKSEWNFFKNEDFNKSKVYVSLKNDHWLLRLPQYVYNYVMCEYFVKIPTVNISLFTRKKQLLFETSVNRNFNESIWCFTDSDSYFPTRVNFTRMDSRNRYIINANEDGYYWCVMKNMIEFTPWTSERVLFVRNESAVLNLHVVMIKLNSKITLPISKRFIASIEDELNDFLLQYLYDDDTDSFLDDEDQTENYFTKFFDNNKSSLEKTEINNIIESVKIKMIFNGENILLHMSVTDLISPMTKILNENLIQLKNFQIVYIRKALECDPHQLKEFSGTYTHIRYKVGETISTQDCSYYMCTGDFNEGVFWLKIKENDVCLEVTSTEDEVADENEHISTTEETPTTTMSSASHVAEVADKLQNLANSNVNKTQLISVTSEINEVLDLGASVEIPKSLLKNLDTIINKMNLPQNETQVKIVQPNIAIVVAERSASSPVVGIRVKKIVNGFRNDSLHVLNEGEMSRAMANMDENEIVVRVPKLSNPEARISFVAFNNDNAFSQNTTEYIQKVNSRVLSISITNTTTFIDGQYIDIYLRPYSGDVKTNESKMCAYWDLLAGNNGNWSTEGCELVSKYTENGLDICRCNHLTHFAEIISIKDEDLGYVNELSLSIISYVGCVLSLIGLIIIGLTGIIFKSWRSDFSNKVWLHLSVAVTFLIVVFLTISTVDFKKQSIIVCIILGVILHYSLLSSFCWMLISAILSYRRLVTVFSKNSSHRLLKACLFGWFIPLCPIIILFAIDQDPYPERWNLQYTHKKFCYPIGLNFWLTVFLPVVLIVVANLILFLIIIYSVFLSSNIQRHGDTKQIYRSITISFLLFFLFGLTWVFGLFLNSVFMMYLFCVTATFQGFILFLFFIAGNKKTRDLWCIFLRLKEKKKFPITTSVSRSTTKGSSSQEKTIALKNIGNNSTRPRAMIGNTDNNDYRFS